MKYDYIIDSIRKQVFQLDLRQVIVALSGGADSIATAFILKKIGLEILALHCNFHLRGDESNRDMKFVEQFCEAYRIPLEIRHFDVDVYMNNNPHTSVEMACRDLRHKWFENRLISTRYERIATGHNADDNIETLFLNLLRGSGTRGLRGMTVDNGKLWRPLLNFHRTEIIGLLERYRIDFIVDSTNLTSDYRRNFLRNEVFPLIKTEWNGFEKALDCSLCHLQEENSVVEYYLSKILETHNDKIPVAHILSFPSPLLLIRRFIEKCGPYTTTQNEVLDAIKANKPHIRKWSLKYGDLILRNGVLSIEMGHGE